MSTRDGSSSGSSSSSTSERDRRLVNVGLPTPASQAPRGASLGQSTSTGGSLVSNGDGTFTDSSTGTTTAVPGSGAAVPMMRSLSPTTGGGIAGAEDTGALGTTVVSQAAANSNSSDPTPLSSEVRVGNDRNPAVSTNFVTLAGGAGGLGRRTAASKRTLIGGA